jgi:hypothetical protein
VKRVVFVLLVASWLALLIAAASSAAVVSYTGKVVASQPSGTLAFEVKRHNGKPKRVRNMTLDSVKLHCEDGNTTFVGRGIAGSARVTRRGRFTLSDESDSITGRIAANGKVRGKISVQFAHPFHGACTVEDAAWRGHPA